MNRNNKKAKQEAGKKSKSSNESTTPTPQKKKEQPKSESDSRSEKIAAKYRKRADLSPTTKSRITSPEKHDKRGANNNVAEKNKKVPPKRVPVSPAKRQKAQTPPRSEEVRKKSVKSDEMEKTKKAHDDSVSNSSGSNETMSSFKCVNPKPKQPFRKNIRSERSLIGLDGETELEYEKNPKDPPSGSPSSLKGSRSQEESSASELTGFQTKESISLADDEEQRDAYKKLFKEFAMNSQKLTLDDFKLDYSLLPGDPGPHQCVAFHSTSNLKKNRYTNIPCLDTSRVRLTFMANKNVAGTEYIHANYIKSQFLKQNYILTQGPKKETVADFWRMVWQEKSSAIVMLCQFVEMSREKCVEYFPRNANCTLRFDKLILSHEESTVNKTMVTTRLRLFFEGEARVITHFQWREWPDYQVPGSSEVMLKILRKIRARSTPPVIHCAAGVGRSGTFMAVEIALQAINGHFQLPDIKQIVTDMRLTGRASSVQTLQQYMLIWKVVLDFGVSNKLIPEESVGKFLSTYRRSLRHHNSS